MCVFFTMEGKHQALADVLDSVTIVVPSNQPRTVSEHMLAAFESVEGAEHKTNKAQQFEIAFLELTLANKDHPELVALFLQRRLLFLQDVITAGNKTALYFLRHNAKYAGLDPHDRERALLAHKQAEDAKGKPTVTAVVQAAPPARRGRGGHGRGGGHFFSSPRWHQQPFYGQAQHEPEWQEPAGRGHGGPPMMSPMRTRGGRGFGYGYGHGH